MTKFRLFQTERVCRRQFQIGSNWQKVLQMGRKHYEKRRNCSFPTVFSKDLLLQTHKYQGLFGKGLNIILDRPEVESKICVEKY